MREDIRWDFWLLSVLKVTGKDIIMYTTDVAMAFDMLWDWLLYTMREMTAWVGLKHLEVALALDEMRGDRHGVLHG